MSAFAKDVFSSFWSSSIWLPPDVTWETIEQQKVENVNNGDHENYAEFSDLLYSFPLTVIMMLIRLLVEKLVFKPLGLRLGLRDTKRSLPAANAVLEEAFKKSADVVKGAEMDAEMNVLCQKAELSEIQVERWFRQRKQAALPNKLKKFTETGWRWVFYTGILLYGLNCLWDKPWFWDVRNCWVGYPDHKIGAGVWKYYMVELAFYMSLSISQFFDVKRKDFWEMFIHHATTIALILFSWTTHFIRIGTLVLLIHDCADPILEMAKMLRYLNYKKTCDILFVLFAFVWIVTRCLIFPTWILSSTLYEASKFIPMFPAYFIFNGLLVTLQCLHLMWTFFLLKGVHRAVTTGVIDDERSDSETSEDENKNDTRKAS